MSSADLGYAVRRPGTVLSYQGLSCRYHAMPGTDRGYVTLYRHLGETMRGPFQTCALSGTDLGCAMVGTVLCCAGTWTDLGCALVPGRDEPRDASCDLRVYHHPTGYELCAMPVLCAVQYCPAVLSGTTLQATT
eukprot:19387-Rhodomonas_salina.3